MPIAVMTLLAIGQSVIAADSPSRPPNIVLILADDLGYGDVSCFAPTHHKTPNLDRLAASGMKLTSFYVSQAVCTASRASILSGCYANRVGLEGALNPTSKTGINPDEQLLPELLKVRGYATALFGKWHLGHLPMFHPYRHGFDEYFGLPYPNDCSNKYHPIVRTFPPLPLYDGEKIVAEEPDQSQFTKQITARSVEFIERNRGRPFFLYVADIMPHVPIFASEKFAGKSGVGLYGDVIEELDWSIGEIATAIEKQGLTNNTLIVFSSDNGPFLSYGDHAGSPGAFRGGKLTCFEGGVRMPTIAVWPKKIPAGATSDSIVTGMDLLPTFVALAGAAKPGKSIDGTNVWPVLAAEQGAPAPREVFYYYADRELHAVRKGKWKLHLPHPYLEVNGRPGTGGKPANFENMKPESITLSGLKGVASRHGYQVEQMPLSLFDLSTDVAESKDVAAANPDVVNELQELAEAARAELGDSLQNKVGWGVRACGKGDAP